MAEGPPIALADTIEEKPASVYPRGSDAGDALIGRQIDHFRFESILGKGGMGAVYVARDVSLDRPVAVKMLRGELTVKDQEDRLMREARAQAKLNHHNVVSIYYIGRTPPPNEEQDGSLYLAMELVDGPTLGDIIDRGDRMHAEQARTAMIQVARGLKAAAKAGIIHRDIKPSNLLRAPDGTIKIADFGLAKPIAGDVAITQEGAFVGSPLYMSPEQASGDPIDKRADMYSMGATFYHLVAGHPPFDGDSPLNVISRHLSKAPPALSESAPEIPVQLRNIIMKLLNKSPDDRFEDYDELIDALEMAAPGRAPYAGFWIRGAAVTIDGVLAAIAVALLGWIGIVMHLLHVTVGHALFGQTVAKHLLSIRVLGIDGKPLGWGRAATRTVAALWMPLVVAMMIFITYGFSGLTTTIEQLRFGQLARMQSVLVAIAISNGFLSLLYAIGLALAGFDSKKRSLHDLLVGSVVRYDLRRS